MENAGALIRQGMQLDIAKVQNWEVCCFPVSVYFATTVLYGKHKPLGENKFENVHENET
jgi:hypothetical protein